MCPSTVPAMNTVCKTLSPPASSLWVGGEGSTMSNLSLSAAESPWELKGCASVCIILFLSRHCHMNSLIQVLLKWLFFFQWLDVERASGLGNGQVV